MKKKNGEKKVKNPRRGEEVGKGGKGEEKEEEKPCKGGRVWRKKWREPEEKTRRGWGSR